MDDIDCVLKEVGGLKKNYYILGIELGLPVDQLMEIRKKFPDDHEQALQDTLQIWLKQQYNVARFNPPTWRGLVEAVNSLTVGDSHAFAEKIESNHPMGEYTCMYT